ncbi:hypothetical protein ACP4OV_011933 [Aristida adscensionis]
MGFQPWVPQEDSNWEIRVAVLLSLLLQTILIFAGPMRKHSSTVTRSAIWSCYLLADLALGLLLNNMGNIGGAGNSSSSSTFGLKRGGGGGGGGANANAGSNDSSSSPIIFAFWTPFLLLHLGGPDTITAYSLEDNELWLRHLIGLLFELFSALVIFGCSLHGNPMVPATVLILVAGVIKYGERTYSLYRGSTKGLGNNILRAKKTNHPITFLSEDDVEEWGRQVLASYGSTEARAYYMFSVLRPLFFEMTISSNELRIAQDFFLGLEPSEAFEMVELQLNFVYDMIYTKAAVAHTRTGWVLRLSCIVSALIIFHGIKEDAVECLREEDKIIGVCNSRGEHILERREYDIRGALGTDYVMVNDVMVKSARESEFDASLLTWHIATDMCLLDVEEEGPPTSDTKRRQLVSETLSEYLMGLLVRQSEMVPAKAGLWLSRYQETCDSRLWLRVTSIKNEKESFFSNK